MKIEKPAWTILSVPEYDDWYENLDMDSQEAILADLVTLSLIGPELGRPHADTIKNSKHSNLKELRTRHKKYQYRVFYAFSPERKGMLLLGGNKSGNKRFYEEMVPQADRLYDKYIKK